MHVIIIKIALYLQKFCAGFIFLIGQARVVNHHHLYVWILLHYFSSPRKKRKLLISMIALLHIYSHLLKVSYICSYDCVNDTLIQEHSI
jgi:hypothetical protein